MPIDFTRRTALYRFFDIEGQLLYVGVAFNPEERWKDHATFKPWWPLVAEKKVQWFDSRTEALASETQAIRSERPLHNVAGTSQPRSAPAAVNAKTMGNRIFRCGAEWDAYAEVCAAKGISRSDDLRLYIKREVAAHKRRQRAEPHSDA